MKEYQTNPGIYYFINDHLGTPQQLINATGTVVWQAAYLPFGKAQIITETITNNLRFPGQYYDSETGLHYNWHRFYDPETGRYVTADPIGLDGGMNLYAYVNGNPVKVRLRDALNFLTSFREPKTTGQPTQTNDLRAEQKQCRIMPTDVAVAHQQHPPPKTTTIPFINHK